MQPMEELTTCEIGSLDMEVFSTGRGRRHRSSRFQLRCDAIALHENEILLLSVIGPETAVKALIAGLRSSGKDQARIEYSVGLGSLRENNLARCPAGYRVHRTRLPYELWHVLFISTREGFLPIVTEQSLWEHVQSSRFTTPLLREWVPWLCKEMKNRGMLAVLKENGCQAGLLLADDDQSLDRLVADGIQRGHLFLGHDKRPARRQLSAESTAKNLEDYLLKYGPLLGKQAEESLDPLHRPGQSATKPLDLLRDPFEAQQHVIEATRRALGRQKSVVLVGEMGTGKTLMGLAAIHAHANRRPYRALVFCPGQLVRKWEREIRETIPDTEVIHIDSWKDLLSLDKRKKPTTNHWYVIARDRAKLGAKWRPACVRRTRLPDGFLRCPQCGRRLVDDKHQPIVMGKPGKDGQPGTGLWRRRATCEWVLSDPSGTDSNADQVDVLVEGCGSPLWQMSGELRRYEPALLVKRRLKNFFKYLILDEVHEEKGADTAQGHAAAALASSCRKVVALTGTLIGGYAEHLRPLLFRLSPASLIQEGLGWSDTMAFSERYGRIETRVTERSGGRSDENRMSRGSKATIKTVRPGIMPPLFGKHLIDKCIFLGLSEVAHNLPPLTEECFPVAMDGELEAAYRQEVEEPLAAAIKEMMKRRDRRLLGAMLQTLLAYPDYPFGWGPVGYWKGPDSYVGVAMPPNLPDEPIRPKERTLIDLARTEKAQRRKIWVFVQYVDRHDVQGRLEKLLTKAGLRVGVLRSSVPLARREEWIARHAWQLDVVISHPRLVETGLDLFDKSGRHNFPTLCFYESGYNLFTLRQASRRSWRIGQREACRVVYLYYAGTMQERALALMGKKLAAAHALEGKFSGEGLLAMAGEDGNLELALAKSLVDRLDTGDVRRLWNEASFQDDSFATEAIPCEAELAAVGAGSEREAIQNGWLF